MSFSFDKYESFARDLKDSNREEDLRNSVSRGYYSFFHKMKKLVNLTGNQFISHEDLIKKLKNQEELKNGIALSQGMLKMKEERHLADYKTFLSKQGFQFDKVNLTLFWRRYDRLMELLEEERN